MAGVVSFTNFSEEVYRCEGNGVGQHFDLPDDFLFDIESSLVVEVMLVAGCV